MRECTNLVSFIPYVYRVLLNTVYFKMSPIGQLRGSLGKSPEVCHRSTLRPSHMADYPPGTRVSSIMFIRQLDSGEVLKSKFNSKMPVTW